MEKVKYLSTAKLQTILLESLVNNRHKPVNKVKKAVFEAISKSIVLTEGVKENLDKLVDDVMFFFKNVQMNNERIDGLINLGRTLYKNGFDIKEIPSLNKTLHAFVTSKSLSGDRLKEFLKTWLNYLIIDYKGTSPLMTFGAEVSKLEIFLKGMENNKTLQGANNNVSTIISEYGLIYVLKKLIDRLNDEAETLHLKDEPHGEMKKTNTNGLVQHDRFAPQLKKDLSHNDHTIDFHDYRERLVPPNSSKRTKATLESVVTAFLLCLD